MQSVQKKHSNALVVMLKAPVAGQVKTRLVPPLSPKDAARLYRCFIQDTFSRISVLTDIDIIAALGTPPPVPLWGQISNLSPEKGDKGRGVPRLQAARVKKIAPHGITILLQKGKDLGERLTNVFLHLFSHGYKKVAIIGSDSPDLPIEYIEKSFSLLNKKTTLVLGPAEDGGYYLIAMSNLLSPLWTDLKSVPKKGGMGGFAGEIFQDIPWSANTVFEKTIEKAKRAGLKTAVLPKWYDVDDIESLMVLRKNIKDTSFAKTSKLIENIFKSLFAKLEQRINFML